MAAPTPTLPRQRGRGIATASAPNALPPPQVGEGWGGGDAGSVSEDEGL